MVNCPKCGAPLEVEIRLVEQPKPQEKAQEPVGGQQRERNPDDMTERQENWLKKNNVKYNPKWSIAQASEAISKEIERQRSEK